MSEKDLFNSSQQPSPNEELDQQASFPQQQDSFKDNKVKNQRWTERQHILYVLFLDLNREKIKSKLIRRSNSFFKQMSVFIGSKSGTQCRSHHQKYENKYKFPHKIIKRQLGKLDSELFQQIKKSVKSFKQSGSSPACLKKEEPQNTSQDMAIEASCQTDMQGVRNIIVMYPRQIAYPYDLPRFHSLPEFNPYIPNAQFLSYLPYNSSMLFRQGSFY